jgi:serine/threonine-protein kinase
MHAMWSSRRSRLGRYRLVERLGAGGMAEVFRAERLGAPASAPPVVVKRVLPELARDRNFPRMLAAEARLCARLRHPAIVQLHEIGEHHGEQFLVMELVEGVDLAAIHRRAAAHARLMPVGVALYIAAEVAGALAYAHALSDDDGRPLRIVHRDVSPANVMLTVAGTVKLLDFGIARAANALDDERTRTGVIKGKLSYLSPELAEGLTIDRRADIFALGVVLYESLAGIRLFRGADDFETLRLVRRADIAPPSLYRAEVAPALDALVLRMLARDPADRHPDCEALRAELGPMARAQRGDAAAAQEFLAALPPEEAGGERTRVEAMAPSRLVGATALYVPPARRWRRAPLVLALALGLGGVAAGVRWWRARRLAPAAASFSTAITPTSTLPTTITPTSTLPQTITPTLTPALPPTITPTPLAASAALSLPTHAALPSLVKAPPASRPSRRSRAPHVALSPAPSPPSPPPSPPPATLPAPAPTTAPAPTKSASPLAKEIKDPFPE